MCYNKEKPQGGEGGERMYDWQKNGMPYNNLSGYLRDRYGRRLTKICLDGGFTCPNRDGRCGTGGCIYCGGRGAGEHIDPVGSISEQMERGISGAREGSEFIAYFQNFTGTYAPVSNLRSKYDAATADPRVKILAVGTRPDCIDREVCLLLASYLSRCDVWVELGLQTASDETAATINRGYKTEVFLRAAALLHEHGIPFVTHLMIGLPGEGEEDVLRTVAFVNSVRPFGVKLHSVYVMADTVLAEMYHRGEYTPLDRADYVRIASHALAALDPEIVVHRITGDCPRDLLVAPDWNTDKRGVIDDIGRYMRDHGIRQGSGI